MLAEAAREANIPYIMSGGSNHSMEAAAKVAPHHTWYQLYAARDGKISEDLVRRAADCGLETLVLTVDVPVRPRRERNIRNGFSAIRGTWLKAALSLKPSILAEAMQHPGWVWE
jgi:(S)-mandelate dehydrogenase